VEAKACAPKGLQYQYSTFCSFAPEERWKEEDDFEADTDDEYNGRGEDIDR